MVEGKNNQWLGWDKIGDQIPLVPTPQDPGRWNNWLYGLEELLSHLDIPT